MEALMKQLYPSLWARFSARLFCTCLCAGVLFSPKALSAEEGSLTVAANVEPVQEMTEQEQGIPNIPHHYMELSGSFDGVGKAHFTKKGLRDETLRFSLGGGGLRYVQFLGCRRQFAATAAIEYFDNLLDWKNNSYFSQKHFHNLAVSVGGVFQGEDWLWKGNIGASFDMDVGQVGGYTLYSAQLWGRYAMTPLLGLHIGVIGITGLHENRAWPIIGFDYTWREKWKLRLIYPVDLSLFYMLNCHWSVGVVHRLFWVRHRVAPSKQFPGAFVEYRNRGTELAVRYEIDPFLQLNVHVGYSHGGELCLSESAFCGRAGQFHRRRFKRCESFSFGGSGYVGGQLSLKF